MILLAIRVNVPNGSSYRKSRLFSTTSRRILLVRDPGPLFKSRKSGAQALIYFGKLKLPKNKGSPLMRFIVGGRLDPEKRKFAHVYLVLNSFNIQRSCGFHVFRLQTS